jgi:ribonuclease T1
MASFAARKLLTVSFLLASSFFCTSLVQAGTATPETSDTRDTTVALTTLPPQGQQTYRLIYQGGPFPYQKDGVVFGNRERRLPAHERGYYREYTVQTPGVRSRGARRIACGGPPRKPEVCYYSDDHYASFRRISP